MNIGGSGSKPLMTAFCMAAIALSVCAIGAVMFDSEDSDAATTYAYDLGVYGYGDSINQTIPGITEASANTLKTNLAKAGWSSITVTYDSNISSGAGGIYISGTATNSSSKASANFTCSLTPTSGINGTMIFTVIAGVTSYGYADATYVRYGSTMNMSITGNYASAMNEVFEDRGWNLSAEYVTNKQVGTTSFTGTIVSGTATSVTKKSALIPYVYDGKIRAICVVDYTVPTFVSSVSVSGNESVDAGSTVRLTATTGPTSANTDRTVTWEITSGSSYASIKSTTNTTTGGTCTLEGLAAGTVTLKATADDGTAYATTTVTVNPVYYNYILKYSANGGSGAPASETKTATDKTSTLSFTITSVEPTYEDHKFLGWATTVYATSPSYTAGNTIGIKYGTTTLYAVWEALPLDYTLTFSANGGTGAPGQMSGSSNTGSYNFTLPATVPSKSGSTFLGWSTSSSASTATYQPGGTYNATSTSVTLYAVWKAIEYTCTLNYSATGASNVPDAQTYTGTSTGDHTFTISSDKPTKNGYKFLGWSTTNGSPTAAYQPGGSITVAYNGTKTLYAVWQNEYTCTLNYSATGASNVPGAQTYSDSATTDHVFTIASNKPAKDGCSFLGWSTTDGATEASYLPGGTISVAYNGTVTLYAVWEQNLLSITSSPSTTATVGTQYVYDVTANVSGCTVTVSGASWLSVSGMKISGTTTVSGTYNVTVTVSKTGYADAVQNFTINVESVTDFTAPPSAAGIFAYVS